MKDLRLLGNLKKTSASTTLASGSFIALGIRPIIANPKDCYNLIEAMLISNTKLNITTE
jgi:hypothetical protein